MNDTLSKWIAGVATAVSMGAVAAIFTMWNSLGEIRAQQPLRDQLRAFETEQLRQGIQLNDQQLAVFEMELREIEDRLRELEQRP